MRRVTLTGIILTFLICGCIKLPVNMMLLKGEAYITSGQYEDAVATLDEVVRLNRKSVRAFTLRGIAYSKIGEYDKALADFNKALDMQPECAEAYYNRGVLELYKADIEKYEGVDVDYDQVFKKAVADFDRAVKYDPGMTVAYLERSKAFVRRYQVEGFVKGVIQYRLDPTITFIREYETWMKSKNNLLDEVSADEIINTIITDATALIETEVDALQKKLLALKVDPELGQAFYNRALAFFVLQHYTQAIDDASMAVELKFSVDPEFIRTVREYNQLNRRPQERPL